MKILHKNKNKDIAESYDCWAETYDIDHNQTRKLAENVLKGQDLDISGRSIIEIGCGTGINTQWLSEQAKTVLALDISIGMLKMAKARVQTDNILLVRHDIRCMWPCGDGSADLIIAMLILEHVDRLEPVFQEAARVLKSGGKLFLCELHPTKQMLGRQAEFINSLSGEIEKITAFLHDVSEYVNGGIQAGFKLTEIREWRDEGSDNMDPPRLLSLIFDLPSTR